MTMMVEMQSSLISISTNNNDNDNHNDDDENEIEHFIVEHQVSGV